MTILALGIHEKSNIITYRGCPSRHAYTIPEKLHGWTIRVLVERMCIGISGLTNKGRREDVVDLKLESFGANLNFHIVVEYQYLGYP